MELKGMDLADILEKSENSSIVERIFRRLDLSPSEAVSIKTLVKEFNALETESGANLLSAEESEGLYQFTDRFPEAKFDLQGACQLLTQVASDSFPTSTNDRDSVDAPSKNLGRRSSLRSVRIRANPLPEILSASGSSPFTRPQSPSQVILNRSHSVTTGTRSPFFRHERSVSAFDKAYSPKIPRKSSMQSLSFSPDSRCQSPIDFDLSDLSPESSIEYLTEREKSKDHRQVRRVASELNKRLEESESNLSKLDQDYSKRIARLETELSASKSEVSQKRKALFDLRSEIRVQSEQIENLEKDNSDLKLGLADFKKCYYQTKKQLEASRVQKKDHSAVNKSRIEELEERLRGYEVSQREHQLLVARCNAMTKTISNLEQDVAIAQTVAKNFDELVQENFQLKENIENLQKSLVETFQPPAHTIDTPTASFINETPKSVLACLEECGASPRTSGSWLFSGSSFNSRQMKELDRENRYLKRHIDKTWGQWDRVKNDLVTLVEAAAMDPVEASKRRLGQALAKMERYRPAKAYPNFQRASIQQILIDDRPAISSTEMTPAYSSPLTYESSLVSKATTAPTSPPLAEEVSRSISECVSESKLHLEVPLARSDSHPPPDPKLAEPEASPGCTDESRPSEASPLAPIAEAAPEPSSTTIPPYLTRRANRKAGSRSIKKVSFIDLSAETLASDTFGSQPPPSPLPTQSSAFETSVTPRPPAESSSTEATQSPVVSPNLLQIGDVPSHALFWNTASVPKARSASESDASSQLTKEAAATEPYVVLILYAVAAYFLTYWTSTSSQEPQRTHASPRGSSSSRDCHPSLRPSRNQSNSENRVLRIPDSPSVSEHEDVESEEEEKAYGDKSLLILKFWFEMLVMGGSSSNE